MINKASVSQKVSKREWTVVRQAKRDAGENKHPFSL